MKKVVVLASLALIGVLLISCVPPETTLFEFLARTQKMPVKPQATIALTEADDGKTIEVKDGTFIQISLPVNPTSGYGWVVKDAPGAARVVVRFGEPAYEPDDPFSLKPDADGHVTYRFQALGLGEDRLELELRRGEDTADTFTITIESLYAE